MGEGWYTREIIPKDVTHKLRLKILRCHSTTGRAGGTAFEEEYHREIRGQDHDNEHTDLTVTNEHLNTIPTPQYYTNVNSQKSKQKNFEVFVLNRISKLL